MKEAIFKLKVSKVIKKCNPIHGQFISPYFLVLKPNSSKCFILNLKNLNKFIKTSHFKLEDLRTATKLISKNSFMCHDRLKDAYYLIKIDKNNRKFLRFIFKDTLYVHMPSFWLMYQSFCLYQNNETCG